VKPGWNRDILASVLIGVDPWLDILSQ